MSKQRKNSSTIPVPPNQLKKFIEEYIVALDYRVAADKAGISHEKAIETLYHPDVEAMLDKRISIERNTNVFESLLRQRILHETLGIALSDVGDFIDAGNEIKCIAQMPSSIRRQVKSIKVTPTKMGPAVTLTMHDKLKALEMVGKHVGLWSERDGDAEEVQQALRVLTLNQLNEVVEKTQKMTDKPEEQAYKL